MVRFAVAARLLTELDVFLAGDVAGSAALADLIRALRRSHRVALAAWSCRRDPEPSGVHHDGAVACRPLRHSTVTREAAPAPNAWSNAAPIASADNGRPILVAKAAGTEDALTCSAKAAARLK